MTTLGALLERNRRANDLKRGLDRGIDHDELRQLISAYRAADWQATVWPTFDIRIDHGRSVNSLNALRDELRGGKQ